LKTAAARDVLETRGREVEARGDEKREKSEVKVNDGRDKGNLGA
jgi:hypothetical protein